MCEKIPTESQCFLGIEISVGILYIYEITIIVQYRIR